jgi:hypothetical protein
MGRRFPHVLLSPEQNDHLREVHIDWRLRMDEAARALMLLDLERVLSTSVLRATIVEAYRTGDTRERVAILRALPLLRSAGELVELAVDACRTSVTPIFAAIAADNPYPAVWFPPRAFRQLVMKAVFMSVSLDSVRGIAQRADDELRRMAADLASERHAAGRAVPYDLGLLGVVP